MKSIRKNLPLLMLTLVLCTACQDKNAESVPSDKDVSTRSEAIDNYYQTGEYNFPTNEDGTIDTTIPDDVLLLLSNQELIRLVLLHPRVDSLSYYNTIDLFFVSFRSTFNGLDYLLSKDGVENTLIEEYFSIPVSQVASNLPRSQYIDKNNARDFKNFFLEAMLAIVNEPIYYASQKPELLRLVHDKFRKKVELAHETTFYYESSDASRMFIIPIL